MAEKEIKKSGAVEVNAKTAKPVKKPTVSPRKGTVGVKAEGGTPLDSGSNPEKKTPASKHQNNKNAKPAVSSKKPANTSVNTKTPVNTKPVANTKSSANTSSPVNTKKTSGMDKGTSSGKGNGTRTGNGNGGAKRNKKGFAACIIGCIIASIIIVYFLIDLSAPIVFRDFYKDASRSAKIPGLDEAFVPQGFAYSEELSSYLVCGYMSNSEASRLYVVDGDGACKEIRLLHEDGDVYTGHAGGVSCNGNNIYVSNNKKIYYLSLESVKNAKDLESIRFEGSFSVPCRSSFTFCDDKMLYVGEFYAEGYNTADDHKLESADGTHGAFVFGYELDEKGEFGVKNKEKPDIAYSVCDKVQGFAMTENGKAVLSCSYGLSDSNLKIYDTSAATALWYNYEGELLPLYVLDSKSMEKTVVMPLGSEDIDYHNGKVIIGFEFGAKKYGGGLLPFAIENIMLYDMAG